MKKGYSLEGKTLLEIWDAQSEAVCDTPEKLAASKASNRRLYEMWGRKLDIAGKDGTARDG